MPSPFYHQSYVFAVTPHAHYTITHLSGKQHIGARHCAEKLWVPGHGYLLWIGVAVQNPRKHPLWVAKGHVCQSEATLRYWLEYDQVRTDLGMEWVRREREWMASEEAKGMTAWDEHRELLNAREEEEWKEIV